MAVKLDKIFRVFFLWLVFSWKCTECQNAKLTANPASVSLGGTITLTCMYIGSKPETAITWLNSSNIDVLTLIQGSPVPQCDVFSTVNASFDPSRLHYTCDETTNNYTLTIYPVKKNDFGVKWSCTFLDPLPNTTYSELTINETAETNPSTGTTPGSGNCQLVLILCLVLVFIIAIVFIIIIIVILICTDDEHAYTLGLVVGISFGITLIVCCIIIAILISTGTTQCKLELGLALVLPVGIICIIIFIIAVILRCSSITKIKGKPKRVKFGEGIHRGFLYSTGIGFIVVYFVCTKDEDNQEESDELHPVETCETCVGTDANFSFTVTEDCKESEVVIKNESGGIVMTVHGKKVKSDDSLYKDRVTFTGDMKQMQISFILRNVTLEDAGIYLAVLTNPVKTIGRLKLIVKALKKSKTNNSGGVKPIG